MDNGEIVNGIGQGSYESKGKHKWATANTMEIWTAAGLAARAK